MEGKTWVKKYNVVCPQQVSAYALGVEQDYSESGYLLTFVYKETFGTKVEAITYIVDNMPIEGNWMIMESYEWMDK